MPITCAMMGAPGKSWSVSGMGDWVLSMRADKRLEQFLSAHILNRFNLKKKVHEYLSMFRRSLPLQLSTDRSTQSSPNGVWTGRLRITPWLSMKRTKDSSSAAVCLLG